MLLSLFKTNDRQGQVECEIKQNKIKFYIEKETVARAEAKKH